MKKIFIITPIVLMLICFCISLNADFASAGYKIEVSIPGGPTAGTEVSLPEYIKYIYIFGLSLIGITALGVLVYGGFMYMLSDTVVSKDEAKKYIWAAISGLILGLCAYLILNTINPDLTSLTPPNLPSPKEPAEPVSYSCSVYCPDPSKRFEGTRDACNDCIVAGLIACKADCNVECQPEDCVPNY